MKVSKFCKHPDILAIIATALILAAFLSSCRSQDFGSEQYPVDTMLDPVTQQTPEVILSVPSCNYGERDQPMLKLTDLPL